ncbi:MAG: hypothetical protein LBU09_00980 [Endomicrobium sp.]|jgi:hypothetical protein|nr:hypothetical protein [Endomicrobium sp.]
MANIFNMTSTQFTVEIMLTGKKYDFIGFHSATITDPRATHITRGADSLDKSGIEYSEGITQPITVECTVRTTQNFYELFKTIYDTKARVNVYIVDRTDGRIKAFKNSILQKQPFQTDISESEDSLNVSFVFETFNFNADYKDSEGFK